MDPALFVFQLLKGDAGARQVLKKLGEQVHYLSVQDEAVIFDIDTPEDFEKLITNKYKSQHI